MTTDADTAEEDDGPEHQIRMLAVVSLLYTPAGWVVEEDPTARLDPDDDLVCVNEGHMLSPAARGACDRLKDHARNLPMPTPQQVAEAFLRSAARKRGVS